MHKNFKKIYITSSLLLKRTRAPTEITINAITFVKAWNLHHNKPPPSINAIDNSRITGSKIHINPLAVGKNTLSRFDSEPTEISGELFVTKTKW